MSLTKIWAPYFQSSVRMRGRAYHRAGRVTRLAPEAGELIRAVVRGSQDYVVTIRGRGADTTADCTCPFFAGGTYCKHIWATLLELQQNPVGPVAAEDSTPAPPKARKRGVGGMPLTQREPEWSVRMGLFQSRAALAAHPPAGSPPGRQVCFVIDREASLTRERLVVGLRHRDPTATGWSRLKTLRLARRSDLDDLPDAADRELLGLLLGGEVGDHWHMHEGAIFHGDLVALPRDSQRLLMQRILATGRCYLHSDAAAEKEPLTWDGPEAWTLHLVGEMEDRGLRLRLEFRRGQQRMAMTRPDLIIPGPAGVLVTSGRVAPFDDRDAGRWLTFFRESALWRASLREVLVPSDDLPQFVERLYRVPALPELDLPEDLGLRERIVEPMPRLDVFSPDALAAQGVAAVVPKSQLLARVAFEYEGVRVSPTDIGRFLAARNGEVSDAPADLPQLPASALSDAEDEDASPDQVAAPPHPPGADADPAGSAAPGRPEVGQATPAIPADGEDADANNDPDDDLDDDLGLAADDDSEDSGEASDNDLSRVNDTMLIRRDLRREQEHLQTLLGLGLRRPASLAGDMMLLPARDMPGVVLQLLQRGWIVSADQNVVRRGSPPKLAITSGIDWFELHGSVTFETAAGIQTVALPELLAAIRAGRHMIRLGDGSQGLLPEEWLQQHGLLTAVGKVSGDHLRFRKSQAALLDALLDDTDLLDVDEVFAQARRELRRFQGIAPLDPAATFVGSLRPYQREGLGWLAFLRRFGLGGILADDMGLGKTIQVLAMLDAWYGGNNAPADGAASPASTARSLAAAHLPSLVVAPRSVVFNWIDEAQRFAPRLRVQAYTGADRQALRDAFLDHDVIVTTYGLVRRDIAELREHAFQYVILDEAQAIKNPASLAAKAARLLQANHRLALSGTPVENHLGDLWSIFEFLNPGMLGSSGNFGRLVRGESETPGPGRRSERPPLETEAATQIARVLRPFVLRRTKQQVLHDLPDKTEQTLLCELEGEQARLYDQLRLHYRRELLGGPSAIKDGPVGSATIMVLEALLRLRQAACHPGLIDPQRSAESSAKLDTLVERVEDLIAEGHKALIFSQFTSMLAIVRKHLDQRGIVYEYLDGQTRHRKQHVQRFQTDPDCPLFLISLKAGGLGLNLTAAGYVFILDPWWNPAVEAQAIDRTHRIGQTRHVFAYRLICKDTVEQRIVELQQRKKRLADAIISGQENLLRTLTRDDLDVLLS